MRISPINLNSKNNFKSNITFDIGGSQREGSCKIYYTTTDADELLCHKHTTLNKLGQTKFKDGDDFIAHLIKRCSEVQNESKQVIAKSDYPKSENIIRNMAVFLPSSTCGTQAYYLPNFRNAENKPLKDIDFTNFHKKLREGNVQIAPDINIKIVQDVMGAGLAISQKLYDNGLLKDGSYYTVCLTGGGCGISNIECINKDNIIVKSSGSGYLSQSLNLEKVSKVGASAPALVENFGRSLGLNNEEIDDLKSCHKAEFTMQNPCTLPKNITTERLKNMLLNTGKYVIQKENANTFTIKIKNQYKKDFNDARENAINQYCLALARLAIIKKTEGCNGLIITGPVAKAVNQTAQRYYGRTVSELVTKHLKQYFNSYELEKMQKAYKFKVICDDKYYIDDNAECRDLIHKAQFISPQRGNWMKITEEDLKNG